MADEQRCLSSRARTTTALVLAASLTAGVLLAGGLLTAFIADSDSASPGRVEYLPGAVGFAIAAGAAFCAG